MNKWFALIALQLVALLWDWFAWRDIPIGFTATKALVHMGLYSFLFHFEAWAIWEWLFRIYPQLKIKTKEQKSIIVTRLLLFVCALAVCTTLPAYLPHPDWMKGWMERVEGVTPTPPWDFNELQNSGRLLEK